MLSFYRAIIENILTSSITVWYGRATQKDIKCLLNVINQAGKLLGLELPSLNQIYRYRLSRKTQLILKDNVHPANKYFDILPSTKKVQIFEREQEIFR